MRRTRRGNVLRQLSLISLVGLLTSCALPMFGMPPGPPAYRLGYHDGCDSGYAVAGSPFYKQVWEVGAPRAEPDYVAGWTAGLYDCKGSFERIQRTVHQVLSPS
jgi:hypothetical protein